MIIDAHIHLDLYDEQSRRGIMDELSTYQIKALIAVSNHIQSCLDLLQLAKYDSRILPALGYHPEQEIPDEDELKRILSLIHKHRNEIVAIGEVGLPYYLRKQHPTLNISSYVEILERFIELAAELKKPIVLHAIYDDADVVCDLLEKYSIKKAHFHWFKGSESTMNRLIQNNYAISVTPDCLYEPEIHELVKSVPLKNLMAETDGPWPFKGEFTDRMTHPKMIHQSIIKISELKQLPLQEVYQQLYQNTVNFYELKEHLS